MPHKGTAKFALIADGIKKKLRIGVSLISYKFGLKCIWKKESIGLINNEAALNKLIAK